MKRYLLLAGLFLFLNCQTASDDGLNVLSPQLIASSCSSIFKGVLINVEQLFKVKFVSSAEIEETMSLTEYMVKPIDWFSGKKDKIVCFWVIHLKSNDEYKSLVSIGDTLLFYGNNIPVFDSLYFAISSVQVFWRDHQEMMSFTLGGYTSAEYNAFSQIINKCKQDLDLRKRFEKQEVVMHTPDDFNLAIRLKNNERLFCIFNKKTTAFSAEDYQKKLLAIVKLNQKE